MALSHRSLDEVVAHKTCRVAVTSRWSNESNGENIVSLHYVRFNVVLSRMCKLKHHTSISSISGGIRVEHFQALMPYTDAYSYITDFYAKKKPGPMVSDNVRSGTRR